MVNVTHMPKSLSVVGVSTVLPRPCGIATFHQDVIRALQPYDVDIVNIAMQRTVGKYAYPTSTVATIHYKKESDYARAAALINKRQPDVVLLQHEFGIFGGKHGKYILHLLRNLSVPVVVVVHRYDIVQDTDVKRKRVKIVHDIARLVDALIIISKTAQAKLAADLLAADISTPVVHIEHGTPAVADYVLEHPKQKILGRDVPTLATFGLIGGNKGIQDIIKIMPGVVRQFPTVIYRVLGRPHPANAKAQKFLREMKQRVKLLGLEKNVLFVTRFLSVQEIMENLQATDIYITFYADPDQTSSGTLAFALAAGCCVISTPYIHAQELLAEGRGTLIPFADRKALKEAIISLLKNERQREEYRQKALHFGQNTAWSLVGKRYADVLRAVARGKNPLVVSQGAKKINEYTINKVNQVKIS